MVEKVTIMKLKVDDLQCPKCYKKVKKLLCKFPQIRNQVYDEKNNIVTITVVCCDPEKLRDKLCCKGCGAIKSIEIVEPPKPKPPEKKLPPPPPPPSKPPPSPPPQPKPAPPPSPPCHCPPPPVCHCPPQVCHCPPPVCHCPPPPVCLCPPPAVCRCPPPVCRCPPRPRQPPMAVPVGVCCESCYVGRPGGPCFRGHGGPPPCYDVYYGRPVYDSYGYGGGRPCYVSRCDEYFCEENTSACTIM